LNKIHVGLLASLIALGCGTSKSGQQTPPPVLTGSIAGAAMACAQMPLPTTGTIYYACDCGAGADASCQAGSDSNPGTSPDKPWQTYKKAQGQFASLAAGDTIAFCKGGAFTGTKSAWVNASCRASNVCTVRDYTPSWAGSSTAMPKLTGAELSFANDGGSAHEEGYQFLNLELDGAGTSTGVFIYNDIKDVLLCNLVLNGYVDAIDAESGLGPVAAGSDGLNARITVRGSQIINNSDMGWIGSCDGCSLEYNYFDHNGDNSPTQHAIYFENHSDASGNVVKATGERAIGNEMHHSVQGSGTSCGGTIFVVHGQHDQMLIEGNLITEDQGTAQEGCWGISLAPAYTTAEGFTNVTILGNTVVNVGNAAIEVEACQNCVIEDNLVIDDDPYGRSIFVHSMSGSGDSNDLTLDADQVLNNTVYANGSEGQGITLGGQGSNHVLAGNAVLGTNPNWTCFSLDLAASNYYSDHNLCWNTGDPTGSWTSSGALASWQTKTGLDAHSLYADPMFKNAAETNYDFTALPGSPVIGAGDPTHGSTVDITGKTRPSPPDIGAYQN
jgi:hypothetical protein